MAALTNAIENGNALSSSGPGRVMSAIRKASLTTGVDFDYMVGKAAQESGFDPDAKARTSSATGLYQFIEKTWLTMVREHGDKYGLGEYASQIDGNGRVKSAALRREILALRKDPEASAMMAAEYASENKQILEQTWGGKVGGTELYLAHFLGAGGAGAFLKALDENPLQSGADVLPKAANANRNVFYNTRTGRERSVAEIYDMFAQRFSGTQPFAEGLRTDPDIGQTIAVEGWDRAAPDAIARQVLAESLSAPDSAQSETFDDPLNLFGLTASAPAKARRVEGNAPPSVAQPLLASSEILFLARLEESERAAEPAPYDSRAHERRSAYNQ